ncbi:MULTISPECIES: hypothetical protein [unclassified Streptomyces]|uniref:hypothetical protein n=1 Tax=unclassified Streptomyces TaxID=2593676 RepID=UPI0033CC3E04
MDVIGVLAACAEHLVPMLVKAGDPALGHQVTSLAPAEASNATAHQEVETNSIAAGLGLPADRVAPVECTIARASDCRNPPADPRARHGEQ